MKSTSSHSHTHSHSRSNERQRSRSREHKHHKSHLIKNIYIKYTIKYIRRKSKRRIFKIW